MYPQDELRQLQSMKQNSRKEFDKHPENEGRLQKIKDLKHNYERSQGMLASIRQVGLTDSADDINKIISHLLDVGEQVTLETRKDYPSEMEGSRGKLRVFSTWVILTNNLKYLATLKFMPVTGG